MRGSRTWKVAALTAAVTVVCAVAAVAAPKNGDWQGGQNSDDKPDVDFSVAKTGGKQKVSAFTLRNVGFSCGENGGGGIRAAATTAKPKIKNNAFEIDQTIDDARMQVKGTFTSKTKSKGTVKWTSDDGDSHCTTGKLDWRANLQQ